MQIKEGKQLSEIMELLSPRGTGAQLHREAPELELSFATSPSETKMNHNKQVNTGFAAAALFLVLWFWCLFAWGVVCVCGGFVWFCFACLFVCLLSF